ncbi:glycerol-3-phosphate acyltransferase [Brevirhabdus pacifica]|uniref:Glycerol-3-phosphate acyltransferase n=1 Tax=Brevirhabdus pacifica TaxID=1267768 RepID=A0A1U7DJZ5_9RHOB|nr:1-acyl-sn-glycerol-3-phosphate acyltransferase [Brevirhabdus pacifica]APX90223.1 glycerol-3-phosphate acyltransferase [Brevirhabdus pacifica]OWU78724.1 glycerol-3-phosphate acyltransferase [Loktanella sp. 22II-4b]PJJ80656.1 glycerol-3-phosphate acyltransferase [Brevirhabdus pacifica]
MFETVDVPIWLVWLTAIFAAVAALDRVLVPSVRWYFRRRMERVVARLNRRLKVPIQPFKLARRHDMIQRLMYDPKVAEAVSARAHEEGIPENVVFEEARKYAREIVPSFSASAYFGFATRAARWLSTALYRVRLGYVDEAALEAVRSDATVIFVMNHRSNMDYVLVTYLAAERSALSYAVGEWARVWPLSRLISSMGAYFIRRRSRSTLYRRVLARYVQLATENGVTQAVFPEGGLSLDGRVGPPKLGLISYILADFQPGLSREVVFVPIAINYDRVLEDRVLLSAAERGERKFRFHPFALLKYLARQLRRRRRGDLYRFGYASVSFGVPLALSDFMQSAAAPLNEALGRTLMQRVRDVVPVLPVPVVASVLLETGDLPREELDRLVEARCVALAARGVHVHVPRDDHGYTAEVGVRALVLRRALIVDGKMLRIRQEEMALLRFYAASIEHHIAPVVEFGET